MPVKYKGKNVANKLPDGVTRVLAQGGTLFIESTREVLDKGASVLIGSQAARVRPLSESQLAELDLTTDIRPPLIAAGGANLSLARGAKVRVNELPDWTLEGRATLQCAVTSATAPIEIGMDTVLQVPAHRQPFWFRACLAVHRAEGSLIIAQTGKGEAAAPRRTETAFDPAFSGGEHLAGYQMVEIEIAPSSNPAEITLSVQFDRHTDPEQADPPYFFIADPHVSRSRSASGSEVSILAESPGPAGVPLVWSSTAIPGVLTPGATLTLEVGRKRHTLKTGTDLKVTLLEDHGHTFVMQASETGHFQFTMNGVHAFNHTVTPDPTYIRIPQRFQTGGTARLSVWDETGTQEFFSTFIQTPRILTSVDVLRREGTSPFPGALMVQEAHRHQSLKAQMTTGTGPQEMRQIAHALSVLESGPDNVKRKPLSFPEVGAPDVSIVIPAHNKIDVTYFGLCSLLLAHNEASFEVILVDDASTDETAEIETLVSGITVIHNTQAERFIRACNSGVAKARGRYVALLNNDVEVTNGWLDALIDAFDRFDNVGLVGSKLIYPDGRLQDAGGIVWGSGNPWNYGNRENPWEPRFCYARQTDYLSGAALMTTREIWDEVGGLSSYLEPMYFEDTDFSFKIRAAGYTTWFVPSSIIYHYEGMTSGTDTSSGFKRFQEVNRPKFKRQWATAFAGGGRDGEAVDLEKDRGITGRVLFIDAMVPRPDRDAGSYAAIQEIRLVQSLGYKVTFLPQNLAHLGGYTEELERMGVEVIYAPFFLSMADYLDRHGADFDAFYITRYYVARAVLDLIDRTAPGTPVLFNNADLHFLRELRAGLAANDAEQVAASKVTRELELDVMRRVDVVLSYNETEHSVIESHSDGAVQVVRCPWVADLPAEVPGLEGRSGLSFLGNYLHKPNAEAVEWFARQVMPLLQGKAPDLIFSIYGAAMPDEIKALASDTIHAEGFVETVSDVYDRHRIFVAPLLSGAGIKGKVLAALAHGIPTVLSPLAAEGIGLRNRHDCLIAKTPQDWVSAIRALQTDDALWQRLSGNARTYIRDSYGFDTGRELMRAAFEAADIYSARP